MASFAGQRHFFRFGVFEIDLVAGEIRKAGMRLKLAPQPFQVLQALLEHPQQVVTREELRERVWPDNTFVDYELALKKAINRLREVLGDSAENPRFVETLPRRRYRLIAPVEILRSAGDPPAMAAAEVVSQDSSKPVARPSAALFKKVSTRTRLLFAALAVIAIFVVLMLYRQLTIRVSAPTVKSLAVLPLKNLSGDPTQEYMADGMTESI